MKVLPDILASDLRIVFCGTAVGECSADRGHYYAGRGDSFWSLLHGVGLTAERLGPPEDVELPRLGLGLADMVADTGREVARHLQFDVPALEARLNRHRPAWVAFTSKRAGEAAARTTGAAKPGLGPQSWTFAGARVFVLPSSSGANQRRDYDGRPDRLAWWAELAEAAERVERAQPTVRLSRSAAPAVRTW